MGLAGPWGPDHLTQVLGTQVLGTGTDFLMYKSEKVIWYLFIFPWILFIANIPGAVITYMALGAVATFSAYIPGLGGSKDS